MTDRADVSTIGILQLRQFQRNDPSGTPWNWFPLVNFAEATEVVEEDGLQVEREKKNTRGPLLGGICWPFDPGTDRNMTEWGFAFPVKSQSPTKPLPQVTTDASTLAANNPWASGNNATVYNALAAATAGMPAGYLYAALAASSGIPGTFGAQQGFQPVFSALADGWKLSDNSTDKLAPQSAIGPNGEKFPGGMPGIVLAGTSLATEERCFVAAGNCLVAPYYNGPGTFGTPVYDLDAQQNIDPNTKAPLQSLMRVYEVPGMQSSSQSTMAAPNNQIPVYLSSPSYSNPGSFNNPAEPLNTHLATRDKNDVTGPKSSGVFALAIECGPTVDGGHGGGVLSDFPGCMGGGSNSGSSSSAGQDDSQNGQPSGPNQQNQPNSGVGAKGAKNTNTNTNGLGPNAAGNSGFGIGNAVPLGAGPLGLNAAGNSAFGLNTQGSSTAGTKQGGSSKGGGGAAAAGAGGAGAAGGSGGGKGQGQQLGAMSWRFNGPMTPGVAGDKHILQTNSKGESFGPAHIDTAALFLMDQHRDGPLDFDRKRYEDPASSGPPWETFLRYDDEFEGWRWETYVPLGGSDTGDPPPPTTPTYPGMQEIPSLTIDQDPKTNVFMNRPRNAIALRKRTISNRTAIVNRTATLTQTTASRVSNVLAPIAGQNTARQEANQLYHVATLNELSVPALLLRPQSFNKGVRDLRNSKTWGKAELGAVLKTSPVVARIEALGAENGDRWTYTTGPVAKSRYAGGSAAGTINFLPPELGLEQVLDGTEPSTVSNAQLNFYRSSLTFAAPSRTGAANGVQHSGSNTANANGSYPYKIDVLKADGTTHASALRSTSTHAVGTNQAGTNDTRIAPLGTGNQKGGSHVFRVGLSGASGAGTNAVATIASFGAATTSLFLSDGSTAGLSIDNANNKVNIGNSAGGTIGFYGVTPVAKQATFAALTDSSGGTPSTTYPASGATYVQSDINNFKASVVSQLAAIRGALVAYGLST